MPQVHATAQARSDDLAVIGYTVQQLAPGRLGRWHEAFLLRTVDRGATWSELSFTRTIASHFRHWGYPVWPPEIVCAIKLERQKVQIDFRDEWVPFEPGGESLWTAAMSHRGL